jgi:secreted PhoX family phosphatase
MEDEALTLEQVYNCDETGLFYKMLSNKTFAARNEKHAYKLQKDRVTLLASSNAAGIHKLPLAVIGKYTNPC